MTALAIFERFGKEYILCFLKLKIVQTLFTKRMAFRPLNNLKNVMKIKMLLQKSFQPIVARMLVGYFPLLGGPQMYAATSKALNVQGFAQFLYEILLFHSALTFEVIIIHSSLCRQHGSLCKHP